MANTRTDTGLTWSSNVRLTDDLTVEEIVNLSWTKWLKDDYSWNALNIKSGPAYSLPVGVSLQDHWRIIKLGEKPRTDQELIDMGELVAATGQKTYHIIHLPLHYEDGLPTQKTTNRASVDARLNVIVQRKLLQAHDQFANFMGAIFPSYKSAASQGVKVTFQGAIFCGNAEFQGSIFLDRTSFWGTTFIGTANFNSITVNHQIEFNEAIFLDTAHFWQSHISNGVFNNVLFSADTSFFTATFAGRLSCYGTTFRNLADFTSCIFDCVVHFERTSFDGRIAFEMAEFKQHFKFEKINWPGNPLLRHNAFEKAAFLGFADFAGSGLKAFAAFDGAVFSRGAKFDRDIEAAVEREFRLELKSAKHAIKTLPDTNDWSQNVYNEDQSQRRLAELEAGCRSLKQEMIKQADKAREQMFYRFELIARREQTGTSPVERYISIIYGFISDYGASIIRPQVCMAAVFILFATIYALIYDGFIGGWDTILLAALTSASRLFPFGAFDRMTGIFEDGINGSGRPVTVAVFMVLATAQTVVGLVLAFLSALAIRRKFQIN